MTDRITVRLRNDLHCVGWGVKLYSLTDVVSQCSAAYEKAGAKKVRHLQRQQVSVERYQVESKLLACDVAADSLAFKYQLTHMQLNTMHITAN